MKRLAIATMVIALFLLMMPTAVSADSSIVVTNTAGDGVWTDNTWTVSIYPGETKARTLTLRNSSSSPLDVETTISPTSLGNGSLVFELDKSGFVMPGRSYTDVTLTIKASGSAMPGTYTTELTIRSEIPPKPSPAKPTPAVAEPEEEEPVEEPEIVEPEEPEEEEPEVIEPIPPVEPEEPEEEEPEVIEPEEPTEPSKPEELEPIEEPCRWSLLDSILAGFVFVALGLVIWQWQRRKQGKRE